VEETRWDLIVQALMRALVVEHVAKVIETTLLSAKLATQSFARGNDPYYRNDYGGVEQ
jgi:hypothetical protein